MNFSGHRLTPLNLPLSFLFTGLFFLLVHLASLHFIFSLEQILSPGAGGILGALESALRIGGSRLDLCAFVLFLSAIFGLSVRLVRQSFLRVILIHIFYAVIALLFTFSYVQFILLFLHTNTGTLPRWPGLSSFTSYFFAKPLWKSPDFLISFFVLWALGAGVVRLLWEWLTSIFLMIVFQIPRTQLRGDFKRQVAEKAKTGENFIEDFKTFIAYAHRQNGNMGLMGIKIKNEIEVIQTRGAATYHNLLAALFDLSKKISRRGEHQLLYQSNIVLSVLFAGEKEAILAASRFEETLSALMKEKFPTIPFSLAVGVIGKNFKSDAPLDLDKACEELFWGAGDQAAKAQDSGKVEILYKD